MHATTRASHDDDAHSSAGWASSLSCSPWLVGTAGATTPLRSLRGFSHIRQLVRSPGQPVSALDLVGAGTGVVAESGLGDLLDRQALIEYRQRLKELDHELAEAEHWADTGRLTRSAPSETRS